MDLITPSPLATPNTVFFYNTDTHSLCEVTIDTLENAKEIYRQHLFDMDKAIIVHVEPDVKEKPCCHAFNKDVMDFLPVPFCLLDLKAKAQCARVHKLFQEI